MSKETPADDPRQQTDWGSHKQTDKPWKAILKRNSGPVARRLTWRPAA
jgi:hypothetical protein